MTKKIVLPAMAVKDLIKIIQYMYEDELNHFEQSNKPTNHIWHSVCALENLLIKNGLTAVPKL